jgi:uncharacterized repeat protein (TIGR02543 family)
MVLLISSLLVLGGRAYAQAGTLAGTATPQPTPIGVPMLDPETWVTSTEIVSEYYTVKDLTLPDGTKLVEDIIKGPPTPPGGYAAEQATVVDAAPASATMLSDVPAFNWVFGCSAVSGSMIAGYYDRSGYSNIYTGPTNGGVVPLVEDSSWGNWSDGTDSYPNNPLIASHNGLDGRLLKGSIDDYWVLYGSSAADPFISGAWTQHTWGSAIGDYMKTSQSSYSNTDGATSFYGYNSKRKLTCSAMLIGGVSQYDGTYGRKLFYEARGYTVTDCYAQATDNRYKGGFSLVNFMAEIDAGQPVFLNLAGHSIVGVGYDSASTTIYIHDTWDNSTHTMTWGGTYSGMALQSVSIVKLAPVSYTLTVGKSGTGSGTVTSSPIGIDCGSTCSANFNSATVVTLSAVATTGSTFAGWSGACTGSGTCQVSMDAAKSVTANFSQITYTLTANNDSHGTVTLNPTGGTYASGTTVTLTPVPSQAYLFMSWSGTNSGDIIDTGGVYTLVMNGDKTVQANFSQITYTLTADNDGHGTVTLSPSGGTYASGTSVILIPVANTGYQFSAWSGTNSGDILYSGGVYTILMDGNKTIQANFTQITYTLTAGNDGHGTVTLSPSGGTYASGTSVILIPVANTGYQFSAWSGANAGEVVNNALGYTILMNGDKTVQADFVINTYSLNVIKPGTGAGSVTSAPAGIDCGSACSASFDYNTSVTLTATAETGSTFAGWNGTCTGSLISCTILMDTAKTVTAIFTRNTGITQPIPLLSGWNLVSFNVHPASTAISDILATIAGNYDLVYAWDASGAHSGAGNWMRYAPGIPGNTLSNLDETMGFWIRMTSDDTLEITGTAPTTTNISLSINASGWNLVGYPSVVNRSMPEALETHGVTAYALVYAYHADDADTWKRYAPGVPGNDLLEVAPAWAYWIKVTNPSTWVVEY